MNRNVDIHFGDEPTIEIQPVTQLKTVPVESRISHFWVGWQLFGGKD
jgi:hypothetical protein